jgi:signal transduction histidine kinase/CheY-like chemotaxis protein
MEGKSGKKDYLSAFIRASQYMGRLTTSHDFYEHIVKVAVSFFNTEIAGFARLTDSGEAVFEHFQFSEEGKERKLFFEKISDTVKGVFSSSLPGTTSVDLQGCYEIAVLPLYQEKPLNHALVLGHSTDKGFDERLLEVYTALADLAGSTISRLEYEIELNEHREKLEWLVEERTANLQRALEELQNEAAQKNSIQKQHSDINKRLRIVFDTLPGYVKVIDTNYRAIDISGKYKNLLGKDISLEEMKKLHCYEVHKRSQVCPECITHKVFETGKMHTRLSSAEEEERFGLSFKVYIAPLKDDAGKVIGAVELVMDITDLRKAEQDMRRARDEAEDLNRELELAVEQANFLAEQASRADRTKSEFLANMSHEIRTPMNAIIGFSDILANEVQNKEQADYVNIIRESSKNLLQIINDILDFSKIEAGQMDVDELECELGPILDSVDSMLRPAASKKGLKFEILQCGKLPRKIKSDSGRLRQCLVNLINNAIKFTDQGHVYVNAYVEMVRGMPYLCLAVEDTGIGITDEQQDEVFKSFCQGDGSATRKYGGTGLGLTITKQLAELLKGNVEVSSREGKGSIFTLMIPVGMDFDEGNLLDRYSQHEKIIRGSEGDEQMPQLSGKVLVAEDNPSNQALIKILLERSGVEAVLVESGIDAIREADEHGFDLILMDMMMPKMNGYDATIQLRNKGCNTPIVALTANAMTDDEDKCIASGCNCYISKPIQKHELYRVMGDYLKGQPVGA